MINLSNVTLAAETATTGAEQQNPGLLGMLPMLLIYGVIILAMYFLLIHPQRKKSKEEKKMRENLQVGDEVTTIGGIIGKVVSIKEETFVLETTKEKTHIRFLKGAIRSVDVRIADLTGATEAPVQETPAEEQPKKFGFFKKNK